MIMVKMIALFKKPVDIDKFLDHYENIHLPLIRKMPGLLKLELHRMYDPRGGEADPFLMAEMYFESRDALLTSMKSPEGKAGGKDLQSFAADYVQIMLADVNTEEF
jgi:uncharacterized protein (TIGR02118 family)